MSPSGRSEALSATALPRVIAAQAAIQVSGEAL